MQNGINHAGYSSLTRNLREHKKEEGSPVPAGASVSFQRNDYESYKEEDRWLRNVHEILLDTEIEAPKNISWAACHVHPYQRKDMIVSLSVLLPLFHENAQSIAMIRRSMDMIRNAVRSY